MKLLLIFTALICTLLVMASAQNMKPSQDKDDEEPVEKLLKVGELLLHYLAPFAVTHAPYAFNFPLFGSELTLICMPHYFSAAESW